MPFPSPLRSHAQRQAKLHRVWGFECSCALCSLRPELSAASDYRIKQIKNIRKQLEDFFDCRPRCVGLASGDPG